MNVSPFTITFSCPKCWKELPSEMNRLFCSGCGIDYQLRDGIPDFITPFAKLDSTYLQSSRENWNRHYVGLSVDRLADMETEYAKHIPHIAEWLAHDLKLSSRTRFLEIGCGLSFLGAEMARRGLAVTGVDSSLEALKLAQANFARQGLKGTFILADLTRLPFRRPEFDLVYGGGVLEHFPQPRLVLDNLAACMQPGGFILNTVPCVSISTLHYYFQWGNIPDVPLIRPIWEFIHMQVLRGKHLLNGFELSFPISKLRKMFQQAGFNVETIGLFDYGQDQHAFDNNTYGGWFYRRLYRFRPFWNVVAIAGFKMPGPPVS